MTKELREMVRKTIAFMKRHRWTRGTYARDKDHSPVAIFSPAAHSFCMYGALRRANKMPCNPPNSFAVEFNDRYGMFPARFNDTPGRKKKEVIAALEGMLVE